jgi:hypothetical protein
MAHIVKRCSRCRQRVPAGARACECGGRVRWLARYIDPEGRERAQVFERQQDAEDFLEGSRRVRTTTRSSIRRQAERRSRATGFVGARAR